MSLGYSFQPVDVDLPEHPRVKTIAKRYRRAALGLYVAGLCYARKHTPGLVPMCFVEDDDPKLVEELVRVGLWVHLGEVGWEIFNWEKKSGRGSTGAERTKRWREKQRAAVNEAKPFVGPPTRAEWRASHVTDRDVTVTCHRVTGSSTSYSISSSLSEGEPEREAPSWFVDVVEAVTMDTGERFNVPEAWMRYAGHRATKGRPRNAQDARYWLGTVMVPEARKERQAASDRRLNQQRRDGPPSAPRETPEQAKEFARQLAARVAARKGAA